MCILRAATSKLRPASLEYLLVNGPTHGRPCAVSLPEGMRNLILVPVDLCVDPSMLAIIAPHVVRGRVDDLLNLPLDLFQPRLKVFPCLLKLALLLLDVRLLPMHGLLQALHRLKEPLRELH